MSEEFEDQDTHEQYDVLGREFIKRYLDMFEPLVEKLCDTVSVNHGMVQIMICIEVTKQK